MAKITEIMSKTLRGVSAVAVLGLAAGIAAGPIMEKYAAPLDTYFNCVSSERVSEETDTADWKYQSKFKTAKEAVDGFKEFAIKESQETFALLKNREISAGKTSLPISKTAKITLLGAKAYVPVYGNDMGAAPDYTITNDGNDILSAFKDRGFKINPTATEAYKTFYSDKEHRGSGFGAKPGPVVVGDKMTAGAMGNLNLVEATVDELTAAQSDLKESYKEYKDAAIVVFGRAGGENVSYVPGGTSSTTGNILGLSAEEKAILKEAEDNFENVIVLINSTNPLELAELKADDKVDSIMWIGYPGAYGFYGVADVLNGTVSPSAHLGDIYAANTAVNPAMQNFGDIAWANKDAFGNDDSVASYLIMEEGIYTGYRYYETRYADVVANVNGAANAKAGTYVNANGSVATTDGTWKYENEVVYPFGYGLSYTTFDQTLESVQIKGNKKSATVSVKVTNTGSMEGKSVVQLYAQTPYTEYDKTNKVEKSAIQLMDYEKTDIIKPGATQTINMEIDLANLASYDYTTAKTYILDSGEYFFAIGDDSHEALNNILAAQGKTKADGMTDDGNAANTYKWTWDDFDSSTWKYSKSNVEVTNRLSDGDSSMNINSFDGYAGTAKYMTRSDWNGTYPTTVAGLTAKNRIETLLKNNFIDVKNNDDVSAYKWGVNSWKTDENGKPTNHEAIHITEMKGADFNDPRWNKIVDQVSISEFLSFAGKAFHTLAGIPSVGLSEYKTDDGPGGSDGGKIKDAMYQGKKYAEMEGYDSNYAEYGTRVAPTPTNLAYSWNKELAYENGEIILGESTLIFGYPIMIGPGVNLHRHAYNGRGGEYYSEDPVLSGYTGSAVVQGAQSKGCLVNVKHFAFNDQEINRSSVSVFMNEQTARELELRNFQQIFEASGKPASFVNDETKQDSYKVGALGTMTSFNEIGAVAPGANKGASYDILRGEWDFKGYSVTDFTGVSAKASPKESILYGTTAFCGFGGAVSYWNEDYFKNDAAMCAAIKDDIKYVLYSVANSAAMNGVNTSTRVVQLNTPWRSIYKGARIGFGVLTGVAVAGWIACEALKLFAKKKEEN